MKKTSFKKTLILFCAYANFISSTPLNYAYHMIEPEKNLVESKENYMTELDSRKNNLSIFHSNTKAIAEKINNIDEFDINYTQLDLLDMQKSSDSTLRQKIEGIQTPSSSTSSSQPIDTSIQITSYYTQPINELIRKIVPNLKSVDLNKETMPFSFLKNSKNHSVRLSNPDCYIDYSDTVDQIYRSTINSFIYKTEDHEIMIKIEQNEPKKKIATILMLDKGQTFFVSDQSPENLEQLQEDQKKIAEFVAYAILGGEIRSTAFYQLKRTRRMNKEKILVCNIELTDIRNLKQKLKQTIQMFKENQKAVLTFAVLIALLDQLSTLFSNETKGSFVQVLSGLIFVLMLAEGFYTVFKNSQSPKVESINK